MALWPKPNELFYVIKSLTKGKSATYIGLTGSAMDCTINCTEVMAYVKNFIHRQALGEAFFLISIFPPKWT